MDDLVGLYQALRSGWIIAVIVLFVGIVAWAYRPSRKSKMDAHARIPLEDEEDRKD